MVGEGLHVLAEAVAVVHDVQGEAELPGKPFDVLVDAGRLPAGVGEDGAVRHPLEGPLSGHERHDRGLDASAEAEDGQRWKGAHVPSSSPPSWVREPAPCFRM